jgi:hypothetical protein
MLVELANLKPNPFRDFTVDPVDPEAVQLIAQSIREDGFWGGVVCRRGANGSIQIAAGQHRVDAALLAKLTVADLYVGDFSDRAMIRVYARENATQRGNTSTALAGTIASTIRYLAKAVFTGNLSQICETSARGVDTLRGQITSNKGMGEPLVTAFLKDQEIPGIRPSVVREQIANLKASGDYARIIDEVREEIEREERQAAVALERVEAERRAAEEAARRAEAERKAAAQRARDAREEAARKRAEEERQRAEVNAKLEDKRRADLQVERNRLREVHTSRSAAGETARRASKAAESEITFDFEGVSRHLKNAHQLTVFRDVVTSAGVRPFLTVDQQANLAAAVVKKAGKELTGAYIRANVVDMIDEARGIVRRRDQAVKQERAARDVELQMQHKWDEFARHVDALSDLGTQINELYQRNPKVDFTVSAASLSALDTAYTVITKLLRRTGQKPSEGGPQRRIAS